MKVSRKLDVEALLRERGFKVTPIRVQLLTVLSQITSPLSVEALVKKLRGKGDTVTIYRALAAFRDAHIVSELTLKNCTYYQFAVNNHKHHIVCNNCGTIESIEFCITDIAKKAAKKSRQFKTVSDHSLEFFGTCRKCTR